LYKRNQRTVTRYNPLASVIIPAWNESVGIQKTIRSVMNNGYNNLEIVCVNDGSSDNTIEQVEKLRKRYWKNKNKIVVLDQENTGKAGALNNGIKTAKGEIIITIDADSYVCKGSIRKLINAFSDENTDVSIGKIIVGNKDSILGLTQYFEYMFGFHYKQTQHVMNSIYIFPGALCAVRKSVIEDVGYFDHYSSTEDLDLSMKIRHNGHRVVYIDDARCVTEGASDIKGLLNQRTRWRHGYLQCLMFRKDFLFKSDKGWYLSYIEIPLSIIGILESFTFPLLFFYLWSQIVITESPVLSIASYLLLPYVFILLASKEEKLSLRTATMSLLIPLLFTVVSFIEIASLLTAIYRIMTNKQSAWTVWDRKGIA